MSSVYHVNVRDSDLSVLTARDGSRVHAIEFEVSSLAESPPEAAREDPEGVFARLAHEASEAVRAKLREEIAGVGSPVVVVLVRRSLEVLAVYTPPSILRETTYDDDGEVVTSVAILDAEGREIPVPGVVGRHAHCVVGLIGLAELPSTPLIAGEPPWMLEA